MTRKFQNPSAAQFFECSIPEPNSGCWLWAMAMAKNGYGLIQNNRYVRLAHRISYEIHRGPIHDGLCVCHKCDVRLCVNPDHLFLGTRKENILDMVSKNRRASTTGENSGRAILTNEAVRDIRSSNLTVKQLANKYGVAYNTIGSARRGESWAHIK